MKSKKRLFNKRILIIALIILAVLGGILNLLKYQREQAAREATILEHQQSIKNLPPYQPSKKPLVLYFSRAENINDGKNYFETLDNDFDAMTSASILVTDSGELTGNVGLLARWIAEETEGQLSSIKVKNLYPQSKKETQKIVLQEQLDGVWPDIVLNDESFEEFDTVYLGFPNWYAEPPRALYKFLEIHDFDGKIIIPFTSDDTNGFSDSVDILKSKLPNSIVLSEEDGLLVNRKDLFDSKEKTQEWVKDAEAKVQTAKNDPINTLNGQKELAQALIGEVLTPQEIEEKVGKYIKFAKGTNG